MPPQRLSSPSAHRGGGGSPLVQSVYIVCHFLISYVMSSPMCQQRGPGYAPTTGCGTDPGAGHRRHGCAAVAVGSPRQELLPRTVGVCGTGGRISSVAATRCGNIICCVLRLEELFLRTIRKAIDKNWVWTGISEAYGWWGVNHPPPTQPGNAVMCTSPICSCWGAVPLKFYKNFRSAGNGRPWLEL